MGSFGSIRTTTIRDFDGGLNVVHDDLNMSTNYSTIETNMFNSKTGTKSKRYGTQYFTDLSKTVTKTISGSYKITEITLDYFPRTNERYLLPEVGDVVHFTSTSITETPTISSATSNYITIPTPASITEPEVDTEYKIYISNDTLTADSNYTMTGTISSIDTENSTITLKLVQFVYPSYSIFVGRVPRYFLISTKASPICEITDDYFVSWNRSYTPANTFGFNFYKSKNITSDNLLTCRNCYTTNITTTTQNFIYIICDVSEFRRNMEVTISGDDTIAGTYSIYYLDDKGIYIKTDLATFTNYKTISLTYEPDKVESNQIVNCTYYKDKIICVTTLGEVVTVDGAGNKKVIWNSTIQSEVTAGGEGSSWNGTTFVCFAVFNGKLTMWNGISKPLVVDFDAVYPCNYLRDGGTDTYEYVPIAKYALGFNHYLICANIYDELEAKQYPDRISISSKDTIGTFYSGDTTDLLNDAVYLDLGTIISANKQDIKGLARYRDKVCVGFDELSLFGTLGNYTTQTITQENTETTQEIHDPQFETVINNHGCICGRTFGTFNSDLICLDYSGLPLFRLAQFSTQIMPARISTQITPEIYSSLKGLKESTIEDRVFSVMNPKENQYLLFIPNGDSYEETTETVCYAYTMSNETNPSPLQGAWSKFTGWNFECGCTSALNEVFLCHGTKIYVLGNADNPVYSDYYDDPDYPPEDEEDISGKAIDFEWELPWADFGDRAATKHSRYLSVSSTGIAKFNVDLYLDYIYTNNETGERDPQLSLEFVGGDSVGYGNGKQLYGGSRRINSEFLFAYPAKYKISKFNIHGSSKYKLNINSITLYYQVGNIRR